jgi:DNA invertase Pin-like site-specific DNA recombinase
MLSMCAAFAGLEREIIRERMNGGLARAKAKGKALGRKPVSAQVERQIRDMRRKGTGKRKIALTLGVGVSTVQRVLAPSR